MYTVKGKADKNHLLTEHMPLVKRLAHHMKAKLPPSVEVDDLIQAGMIGLLDAISRYEEDARRPVRDLCGAAHPRRHARRAAQQRLAAALHAPEHAQDRGGDEHAAAEARPPAAPKSEVAKSLKLSLADYQDMLGDGGGHQLVYYEDFHDDDGNDSFLDRYAVDDADPLRSLMDTRLPPGRDRRHRRLAAAREDPDGPVLRGRNEPEGNRRRDGRVGIARLAAAQPGRGAAARHVTGAGVDWASLAGIALALAGMLLGHGLDGGKLASLVQPAAFADRGGRHLRRGAAADRDAALSCAAMRMLRWVFRAAAETSARRWRATSPCGACMRARDGLLSLEQLHARQRATRSSRRACA